MTLLGEIGAELLLLYTLYIAIMEESLSLSLQQRLQQRLSPLQVKFVKMLEMNGPEVEDEVRRALDDNPALEKVEADDAAEDNERFNETAEDIRRADYASEEEIPFYRLEARNHSVNDTYAEPVAADGAMSLLDMLSEQLAEHDLTDRQRTVALYIAGNLDDNGYLTRDVNSMVYDIEEQTGQVASTAEVRSMLDLVRTLEPAGIGAVDLRECLLLQLKRRELSDSVKTATEIVTHYFDLFSRKHYDRLASAVGVSPEKLREAIKVIRALNPKPASDIGDDPAEERTRHIIPDFALEVEGNDIELTLLNNVPELRIEATFRDDEDGKHLLPQSSRASGETALFIRQKRDEATEFIKILRMRQETLFRVMSAIVRLQKDFFINGDDESLIKPMILKDVSKLTGYDLSVISRAAAGKYVATAHGVYPLKFFFNERPKDDVDASTHELIATLKSVIDAEDKRHPLSDEVITAEMVSRGYDIARRTVAKYREKLGIPVARLRREI